MVAAPVTGGVGSVAGGGFLVEIAPPTYPVTLDLRYATSENLVGTAIYRTPLCLLRREAAVCLRQTIARAAALGLRLRIFDAFRPVEAQGRLWRALPDSRYIADPRIGSSHSRAVAVDLTLEDATGQPLDMGTGFDDMTDRSGHDFADFPADVLGNRAVLLGLMVATGWQPYGPEWWHYQLANSHCYPLLSDSVTGGRLIGAAAV